MSVKMNYVVDTQNKKERDELINYLSSKGLFIALTDDYDGFQLVGITHSGEVGYLGVITANNLVNVHGFKHFASVQEFIDSYEAR